MTLKNMGKKLWNSSFFSIEIYMYQIGSKLLHFLKFNFMRLYHFNESGMRFYWEWNIAINVA